MRIHALWIGLFFAQTATAQDPDLSTDTAEPTRGDTDQGVLDTDAHTCDTGITLETHCSNPTDVGEENTPHGGDSEVHWEPPQTVYFHRTTTHADGTQTFEVFGSIEVELSNGATGPIDLIRLVDADGRHYTTSMGSVQETPDAPVVDTFAISRVFDSPSHAPGDLAARPDEGEVELRHTDEPLVAQDTVPLPATPSTPDPHAIASDVRRWMERGDERDERRLWAFTKRPETDPLPPLPHALFEVDPITYLRRAQERLLASEQAITRLEEWHRATYPLIALHGGHAAESEFVEGALVVQGPPTLAEYLATSDRLERLTFGPSLHAESSTSRHIRAATQIDSFLAGNSSPHTLSGGAFDGRFGGRGGSRTTVGITDSAIDPTHEAWLDGHGRSSRLKKVFCAEPKIFENAPPTTTVSVDLSANSDSCHAKQYRAGSGKFIANFTGKRHGTWVAGLIGADYFDGQARGNPSRRWKEDRTGMAPEANMVFAGNLLQQFDLGNGTKPTGVALPTDIRRAFLSSDVDIINNSTGTIMDSIDDLCRQGDTSRSSPDLAFADGMVWVQSAGNTGNVNIKGLSAKDLVRRCSMQSSSMSSAALVVGATDHTARDLRSAPIAAYSLRGGQPLGRGLHNRPLTRSVVDLVAPGGKSKAWVQARGVIGWPTIGKDGTSFAAPVVAGALADMKHMLRTLKGPTTARDPGHLYSMALLMTDGKSTRGTRSRSTDPRWGAGRFQARRFDRSGMDSPFGWDTVRVTVRGGRVTSIPINPRRVFGIDWPRKLSTDVDRLRIAAWWPEPNLGTDRPVAQILLEAMAVGKGSVFGVDTQPQHGIIRIADTKRWRWGRLRTTREVVGDRAWLIRVHGQNIPRGETRDVYISYYWEDTDRDDRDGPSRTRVR